MRCRLFALLATLMFAAGASAEGWKAGASAVKITPEKPVVMLGFPDRKGPFTSVAQDIWAKALALEDPSGHRAVVVTADLVGFQAANSTDPKALIKALETGTFKSWPDAPVTFPKADGVYWHPVGADDADMFVTREIFPLAGAFEAVRRQLAIERAHGDRLASVFHCA